MTRILPDLRSEPRLRHYKHKKPDADDDAVPIEPPRPSDIEGRPSVGDDPLLDKLHAVHPEKAP
jgi:hypothetical protein